MNYEIYYLGISLLPVIPLHLLYTKLKDAIFYMEYG